MKLLIVDLDGTLFDTKDVNYNAYKEAMKPYGYELDYEYYCNYCNGRHYLDFLPQITTNDEEVLTDIHNKKKIAYEKHLEKAVMNKGLVDIIRLMKIEYKTAVVTTASKKNCFDILNKFGIYNLFDLILTRDDISNSKPNPEGFIKAMEYFEVTPNETIIFEDSNVGLEAAERSGAYFYRTYKYN
jgi:beta-phosphoglucomutase